MTRKLTDKQVLKLAVEKAVRNGWDCDLPYCRAFINEEGEFCFSESTEIEHAGTIIFSHPFAEALFGEVDKWHSTECTCGGIDFHIAGPDAHEMSCAKATADRGFQYHLKQMVLEENPIDYLRRFLEEGRDE